MAHGGGGEGESRARRSTVLIVDDEDGMVELMRDFLEVDGFDVLVARDGPEALAVLAHEQVDCLLLDVMMPGISGFDVCPILFLSAREADSDKIRGLRLGGDDYIVKSATPDEVVARVRAVLRRARGTAALAEPPEGILDFGRLVLEVRAHEARVDGHPLALTAREFTLLRLLAEHPRQVFSRDHLFELVWGTYGDRSTVTTHIRRLREKIEDDPTQPRYIVTVWGVGYRFEGGRR